MRKIEKGDTSKSFSGDYGVFCDFGDFGYSGESGEFSDSDGSLSGEWMVVIIGFQKRFGLYGFKDHSGENVGCHAVLNIKTVKFDLTNSFFLQVGCL